MIENENDMQAPDVPEAPDVSPEIPEAPSEPAPEAPAEDVWNDTEVPAADVQDGAEAPSVDAVEGSEDASMGASVSETGPSAVETVYVAVVEDRPFMTTSFQDYSVTEGLLLLVFVLFLVRFFLDLVRRWF